MNTLKNMNKKLLTEKESTIGKLKHHADQVSLLTRSDNYEGKMNICELEQQVSSLVKAVNRAEGLIDEKDRTISKYLVLSYLKCQFS